MAPRADSPNGPKLESTETRREYSGRWSWSTRSQRSERIVIPQGLSEEESSVYKTLVDVVHANPDWKKPGVVAITDLAKDYDDLAAMVVLKELHRLLGFISNLLPTDKRAQFGRGALDSLGLQSFPIAQSTPGFPKSTRRKHTELAYEFDCDFMAKDYEAMGKEDEIKTASKRKDSTGQLTPFLDQVWFLENTTPWFDKPDPWDAKLAQKKFDQYNQARQTSEFVYGDGRASPANICNDSYCQHGHGPGTTTADRVVRPTPLPDGEGLELVENSGNEPPDPPQTFQNAESRWCWPESPLRQVPDGLLSVIRRLGNFASPSALLLFFVQQANASDNVSVLEMLSRSLTPYELVGTIGTSLAFSPSIAYVDRQIQRRAQKVLLALLMGFLAYLCSYALSDTSGGEQLTWVPVLLLFMGLLILRQPLLSSPSDSCDCGRANCPGCGSGSASGNDDEV